jgi:heme-degrading monooxygenase HmoA
MHARLARYGGLPPERIEKAIADFEGEELRALEQMQGFEGIMLAVDWKAGRVCAISYWATHEDMKASDELAAQARARAEATVQPSREPIVDRYEVVLRKP